jgi:hypothetical protein
MISKGNQRKAIREKIVSLKKVDSCEKLDRMV